MSDQLFGKVRVLSEGPSVTNGSPCVDVRGSVYSRCEFFLVHSFRLIGGGAG